MMNSKNLETFWCKVYIAGDISVAKQILRRECKIRGLCVTVESTTFLYTGGEEAGLVVGFINYPKFPKTDDEVYAIAISIAQILQTEMYQDSVLVQTPTTTEWFSTRPQPGITTK